MRCCGTCGAELVRHPKHSAKQWSEKRFCDRKCSAQRLVKPRSCACGCGGRPLPKRRYIKGHRPIKPTATGYMRVWVGKGHPIAYPDGNALEHRLVLFNAGIEIPDGMHVHHRNGDKLDNRLENLAIVTAAEHTRLHALERTPTHCPSGHEYTPENTAFGPDGWRYCKTCNRERVRQYARRRKAAA